MRLHLKHSLTYLPHCLVPLLLPRRAQLLERTQNCRCDFKHTSPESSQLSPPKLTEDFGTKKLNSPALLCLHNFEIFLIRKEYDRCGSKQRTIATTARVISNLSSALRGRGHWRRIAAFDDKHHAQFQIERDRNSGALTASSPYRLRVQALPP